MKQPIRITIDPMCALGFMESLEESETDGYLDVVREANGRVREYGRDDGDFDHQARSVMVWLNKDDEVVTIEIISIDEPELVPVARDYARNNDLEFPDDLRAAAARNSAA